MTGVLALSQGDIATIVVVVVVALFAILLVGSFVRARRSEAALAAAAGLGGVGPASPWAARYAFTAAERARPSATRWLVPLAISSARIRS